MSPNQPPALTPLSRPNIDPTPIFETVRWSFGSELLTVAIAHFDLFALLARKPLLFDEIGDALNLSPRSNNVLLVALRAMGMIDTDAEGKLTPSPIAREHLVPGSEFYMGEYACLTADNPGVKALAARLRTGKPIEYSPDDTGLGFIFREGIESAMDQEASARRLTLALAGRARIVAPALADALRLKTGARLLDIGGGTGLYAIAMLRKDPTLRAIVWDREQVLKVAREMGERYGVLDRLELRPGDMFADPVPTDCDTMLLSNILHDWDLPECQKLVTRCAASLPAGGRLLIHDVFLNDTLDGPLNVALYSAALFTATEGRAYSAAEYRKILRTAGLQSGEIIPTAVQCGVLSATKA